MKNKVLYLVLTTIIMSFFIGVMIGLCVGISIQKQTINTGDTYKYYDQQEPDDLKVWNI